MVSVGAKCDAMFLLVGRDSDSHVGREDLVGDYSSACVDVASRAQGHLEALSPKPKP